MAVFRIEKTHDYSKLEFLIEYIISQWTDRKK